MTANTEESSFFIQISTKLKGRSQLSEFRFPEDLPEIFREVKMAMSNRVRTVDMGYVEAD